MTVTAVMDYVRIPALLWVWTDMCVCVLRLASFSICTLLSQGFGTALGELPPYFMARAGREVRRYAVLIDESTNIRSIFHVLSAEIQLSAIPFSIAMFSC